MKRNSILSKLFCVAAVSCALAQVNAQNLVQDPGFELSPGGTGQAAFSSAWQLNEQGSPPQTQLSGVGTSGAFSHSGLKQANLTDDPGQTGTLLQQMLATSPATSYLLSFWLAFDKDPQLGPSVDNLFQVFFGGSLVFTATSANLPAPGPNGIGSYRQFFVPVTAATSSTSLQFSFRHDQDFWRLDDISVRVPEGGVNLWLLAPTLAGLCLLYSRVARRSGSVS